MYILYILYMCVWGGKWERGKAITISSLVVKKYNTFL